jgi:DNA-binding transcriptional LysR family regulator
MNPLGDLALFVAVAELKSFTRAAATLGMPTSTLSTRIAALESSLGLKLLNRSTRIVELTEAGSLYLERCRSIVEAAEEAHQQVRGMVEIPQGLLRMSIEAEIGLRLVAPLIAEFLERYPKVTIDLDLSPRRVDLLGENFDLAIRIGSLPDSGLTVRRLTVLQAGLYASPTYLDRHGTPAHPSALAEHARIRLLHQGDRGEWRLTREAETIEINGSFLVSANNMAMILQLARLGIGIAVLDDLIASEDVRTGVLRPVLPDWRLLPSAVSIITPSRLLPAKTRIFINMLTERLSEVTGLTP